MEEKENNIKKAIREFYEGRETLEGEKIFDEVFEKASSTMKKANNLVGLDEEIWKKSIRKGIDLRLKNSHITKSKTGFAKFNLKQFASIAASIFLFITCGIFYYNYKISTKEGDIKVVETIPKQKGNVSLTDGTKIALNVKSSIAFPERFSETERKIELKGEAFFDVARDTSKPFIVQSGGVEVKVLGTSFNIKSYEEDPEIQVTVSTGKVAVTFQSSEQDVELLLPGDQIRYHKKTGSLTRLKVEPKHSILWKEGILLFENQSIETIAKALERNYNVSISIHDKKLKEKRITFKQKGENLANILEAISHLADMQYRWENGNVVFFRK